MSADNFQFDITGAPLEASLVIAFTGHKTAVGWRVESNEVKAEHSLSVAYGASSERPRLVLMWHATKETIPFITPLGPTELEQMVKSWLKEVDYGPEPDIDGSCSKGWRVYNESWGHIGDDHYAFAAIEPVWLMHGK